MYIIGRISQFTQMYICSNALNAKDHVIFNYLITIQTISKKLGQGHYYTMPLGQGYSFVFIVYS